MIKLVLIMFWRRDNGEGIKLNCYLKTRVHTTHYETALNKLS